MNAESRTTETYNPYESPKELPPVRAAAKRRFLVTLIPALLVAALGAMVTANIAFNTTSVLVVLLPSGFSLALSVWLVCHRFARTAAAGRVFVVLFGTVLSVAATGYCLDKPLTSVVTNQYIHFAIASAFGATVFAASLSLSRVSIFSLTLLFTAWLIFAFAAFASLAIFTFVRSGANQLLCIFMCATIFQSIVVSTIAMYMNDTESTDSGNQRIDVL